MNLQDAIDMVTDGGGLRLMTRHNAADFVEAIAMVVDAARQVVNPDNETLAMLNGHPDLYEFSRKQVEALETLGVKMIPVKNEYIIKDVLDGVTALGVTEDK